jgi:hypothetical protein
VRAAGFDRIEVDPTRIYSHAQAADFLTDAKLDAERIASLIAANS